MGRSSGAIQPPDVDTDYTTAIATAAAAVTAAAENASVLRDGTGLPAKVVSASPTGGVIAWTTGLAIPLNQLVSNASTAYVCKTAHTAGVSFDATKFDALGAALTKAAVVATGLAAADIGADASGAAAAAQAAAIAAGFTNPMTTTQDLIVAGASGVPARLPVGLAGQTLMVRSDGTVGYVDDEINAKAWGLVGDGSDETAKIKLAIAAAAGSSPGVSGYPGGKTVRFPMPLSGPGYGMSSTVEIPDTVRVVGDGANSGPWPNASGNNLGTRFLALSSFPPMCPMFTLGARLPAVVTTGVTFSNSIEHCTIDGQNYATVGIYTNKAQEHSRIDFVTVQKCSMIGVHVATPNGSSGANQTNNFGMSNLKLAPTHVNDYKVTTLNGAITVTTGTNPFDAASNYCNPVTTSAQATGTVLVTDTTGFPAAGCVIIAQQSQQAPVVVYYTSVSGNSLVGCYTDATPSQSPALSIAANAQVETPACGAYIQNVGAMRGIEESTFDSGFANATCVGLRLDGCNGVYSKIHCEHVKYGVLMGSASMCAGTEIDHVMLGGDTTVVDLIRVGTAGSGNSQNSFTLRHIMKYVNGPNTINDLSNSNTLTDQYVGLYAVGLAGVGLGGSNSLRPIISTSDQVLTNFKKGFVGPVKSGSDFADADFVNPIDGLSGYRTDNQSFQWRSNGTWHTTSALATLASPTFTGTPLAPTPSGGDNSTKVATTAFVAGAVAGGVAGVATFNGRSGTVLPANGDYSIGQITGAASVDRLPNLVAPIWGPIVLGSIATTTDLIVLARVIVPVAGTLHDITWWVGTSSGNIKVLIYDTGDSSAGHYTLLYNSGAVASIAGGAKWQTVDPALSVTLGQELLIGLVADNGTLSIGRNSAFANATQSQLPANFLPAAGGALAKMSGQMASSYTTPATSIAEASLVNSTSLWVFFARVA